MSTFNQVLLLGNVVRDPEVKTFSNGNSVVTSTVATNYSYTGPNGERKEEPEYHSVVFWGKVGEIFQKYAKKGKKVHIQGRLRTRAWDDATTGQKRYKTEIVVENLILLGKKEDTEYADLI